MARRRFRLAGAGILVVAGLVQVVLVVVAQPASAATPSTLYAGHQLVAGTVNDSLSAPSGEFVLSVLPDSVGLDQYAPLDGPRGPDTVITGVWFRDDLTGHHQSNTDHSILRLRRNGNLVLMTSHGYLVWSSHTGGSGYHNRLVLGNGGNLVMFTAKGRIVWATHTTRVLLPAGDQLASGHLLVDRWGEQQGPVHQVWRLRMQTDGNLVLRCNTSLVWSTHTHKRGSRLLMQTNGNLVIRGPYGAKQWSSHTAGAGPYTWFKALDLQVMKISRDRAIWQHRISYPPPC